MFLRKKSNNIQNINILKKRKAILSKATKKVKEEPSVPADVKTPTKKVKKITEDNKPANTTE